MIKTVVPESKVIKIIISKGEIIGNCNGDLK